MTTNPGSGKTVKCVCGGGGAESRSQKIEKGFEMLSLACDTVCEEPTAAVDAWSGSA